MTEVTDTLKERGTRYGEFPMQALISQELKRTVKQYGSHLADHHREALDMIMHKVARILNGDPNYADSWHDIAGYAVLVEQKILKETGVK